MILNNGKISEFDCLYVDIDDTLITGKFVAFMDLTWRIFKSKWLANVLAYIQRKYKFYIVNQRVAELIYYTLRETDVNVVVLTARGPNKDNELLVKDIFGEIYYPNVVALGSYDPGHDKANYICKNTTYHQKAMLIDDNLRTRILVRNLFIESVHPDMIEFERVK